MAGGRRQPAAIERGREAGAVGTLTTFDEFCLGLTPLQRAVMSGYFNAVTCKDSRNRARPEPEWAAILADELTRPTP